MKVEKHEIEKFVKRFIESYGPDTFVRNEHGQLIYSAGPSSLNLESFFEMILEDWLNNTTIETLVTVDSEYYN